MLYFAYGSNLNLDQMIYRCPDSIRIGLGILNGWEMIFRGPLDIYEKKGGSVIGQVFQISQDDLKALDRYEGYPRFYTRIPVQVVMPGKVVTALVYTMTSAHKLRAYPPSPGYWETVLEGYEHCGLPEEYLTKSLKRTEKAYQKAVKKAKVKKRKLVPQVA